MTQTITRTDLEAGLADGTITAVDALPESYFTRQHIPGAVNLTAAEAEAAPDLLPDKSAAIATYCSDGTCGNSGEVAEMLERLGYSNVRRYEDGIKDWTEAGLPVEVGTPSRT